MDSLFPGFFRFLAGSLLPTGTTTTEYHKCEFSLVVSTKFATSSWQKDICYLCIIESTPSDSKTPGFCRQHHSGKIIDLINQTCGAVYIIRRQEGHIFLMLLLEAWAVFQEKCFSTCLSLVNFQNSDTFVCLLLHLKIFLYFFFFCRGELPTSFHNTRVRPPNYDYLNSSLILIKLTLLALILEMRK